MKIFFLNSSGIATWGGGEKWMFQTGIELNALGHDTYFAGRSSSMFLKKCEEADLKTYPMKISGDYNPITIKKLSSFLKDNHIDIIITEHNKDIRIAGLASTIYGRLVTIARTGLPNIKNKLQDRLLYPRLLDGVIVGSEAIKDKYLSYKWLPAAKIKVIPNGIFPVPYPDKSPDEIKSDFGIPRRKPVIGIFGKLIKMKQHTIFLEIAASVLKDFPDTLFLIVGDGPERENLQNFAFNLGILDHIYMTGFQDNPLPLYTICEMVLLTSQEEGIPHAVMEAMLMERPVVAFDVGGVSELIKSEKNGILIPPNDIYLMTQRVEQLMVDKNTAESIGKNAREVILTQFTIKNMIGKLEHYFKELIAIKRGNENGE